MKSKLSITLMLFVTYIFALNAELGAQTSRIARHSFNMGFAAAASGSSQVKSAVGQSFVGRTENPNTRIESGFLTTPKLSTQVSEDVAVEVPFSFELLQNYPNPFNPETNIKYQIKEETEVRLQIFNIRGQLLKNLVDEKQTAGVYNIKWDGKDHSGRDVASGIYLFLLKTKEYSKARKLTLLR